MAQLLPTYNPDSGLLPLLPLRDVVVYPHLVIPLFVGRTKSVKALELASEGNKQILLVAQKSASKDDPDASDLHDVGTIATVLQMLKLPDGTVKVLVEGMQRAKISEFTETEECFAARPELVVDAASDV
jgi:ATP-dependent Lon protease